MSNSNGLFSSKDVSATGDPDSVFFLRNGVPIAVPSPFQVDSPAGNSVLTISESNTNVATISNMGDIGVECLSLNKYINLTSRETRVYPTASQVGAPGALSIHNADGTHYTTYVGGTTGGGLTQDHLETFAYPSGGGIIKCIDVAPNGQVNLPVQLNTPAILLDGKPVAKPSKVAWVGLGGASVDTITIPASTPAQNVSANFAVVTGHTYRVTAQFRLECADDADPNAIIFVNVTTLPGGSIENVGMAGVKSAGTSSGPLDNTTCYSALFVATADSSTCRLSAGNTSTTDSAYLKISTVGQPADSPNILVEDLGVL